MGGRFDKWLARPATLKLLRSIVHDEVPLRPIRKTRRCLYTSHRRCSVVTADLPHELELDEKPVVSHQTNELRDVKKAPTSASETAYYDYVPTGESKIRDLRYYTALTRSRSDESPIPARDQADTGSANVWRTPVSSRYTQPTNIEELACAIAPVDCENDLTNIKAILEDLIDRGISIPITGPSAEKVWDAFLRAATTHAVPFAARSDFQELLYRYAIRIKRVTGQQYSQLHTRIVGSYLRHPTTGSSLYCDNAPDWHKRFLDDGLARPEVVLSLIDDILQSRTPSIALETWKTLYLLNSRRSRRGWYSRCMLKLHPGTALHSEMKAFLAGAGAKPHSTKADYAIQAGPAALASAALSQSKDVWQHETRAEQASKDIKLSAPEVVPFSLESSKDLAGEAHSVEGVETSTTSSRPIEAVRSQSEQATTTEPHVQSKSARRNTDSLEAEQTAANMTPDSFFTRRNMSLSLGAVHGISEKHIGDHFCARIFATQLFPLSMSIASLRLLGVERIGTLSVREIALRSPYPDVFLNNVSQVRSQGIKLDDSVFLQLLQQVAAQNDLKGYQALLQSDQHPDNYQNVELQTQCSCEYEDTGQWLLLQISLQALALNGLNTQMQTWNALLRKKVTEDDMRAIRQCYRSMCISNIQITPHTLRRIRDLLPARAAGKGEAHIEAAGQRRDFVTSAHMRAAELGLCPDRGAWKELLKRYGMAGAIDKLVRCVLWLGELPCRPGRSRGLAQAQRGLHMVDSILDTAMQKAIVWWCWRASVQRCQSTVWQSDVTVWQSDATAASLEYQTRNVAIATPSEPWAKGIAVLRDLKNIGINVKPSTVREAIRQQLWTIFGPGHSARTSNDTIALRNNIQLADYIKHVNVVWPGVLPIDEELLTSKADTHAALLVAVFGSRRILSRQGRIQVDVESWASTQHPLAMTEGYRDALHERQRHRIESWINNKTRSARTSL
ncbi:hypothetical protein AMS68_001129 [Peltaster fructicola]|uniref:Uncharacterized protein n=1 Tax=Peltaster fructicola TaxID=286661 RepID=A0A6H0XLI4_9PEZI|nr:hypothetical protein AMS68_001129 [Peltaster fructicola]